jgi:hypothetical protein
LFVNILAVSHIQNAGLVNNSLVTDYDIGVLPSEHQDYLKSMVGVQHDKTLKINTHKGLPCGQNNLYQLFYFLCLKNLYRFLC